MTAYRDRKEAGLYEPGSQSGQANELDGMSKEDLLARAQAQGISPANAAMTKAELKAALEQAS